MFVPLKISSLLEEKRTSKVALQKYTGLSKGGLYNILNGISSPTADNLEKIADFFGVSIDYFFEREFTSPYKKNDRTDDAESKNSSYNPILLGEIRGELLSLDKSLETVLSAKDQTIAAKEELITELKRGIRDKEEIISLLKNENKRRIPVT